MTRKRGSDAVTIAGVQIDNLTFDETLYWLDQRVRQKMPCFVVTPNVDHIVQLQSDSRLRAAYRDGLRSLRQCTCSVGVKLVVPAP